VNSIASSSRRWIAGVARVRSTGSDAQASATSSPRLVRSGPVRLSPIDTSSVPGDRAADLRHRVEQRRARVVARDWTRLGRCAAVVDADADGFGPGRPGRHSTTKPVTPPAPARCEGGQDGGSPLSCRVEEHLRGLRRESARWRHHRVEGAGRRPRFVVGDLLVGDA